MKPIAKKTKRDSLVPRKGVSLILEQSSFMQAKVAESNTFLCYTYSFQIKHYFG